MAIADFSAASSAFKKGDIVLFPMTATSGRAFRVSYEVLRVGLVKEIGDPGHIVQEINHPSRTGAAVVIETENGYQKYEGTHEVPEKLLIPRVDKVRGMDGKLLKLGSKHLIRKGRVSRAQGFVIYTFKGASGSYFAVTDEDGWECYQRMAEQCFESEFMTLLVQEAN